MKVILGVDPGFASFGYAALGFEGTARVDEDRHVLHFGVIETQKRDGAAVEDSLRRTRELAYELDGAIDDALKDGDELVVIAAEAMSFVRSASTMAKVGMAWGALATVAMVRGVPLVQARPQEVHRHVTGLAKSSKLQVQQELIRLVPRHACSRCIAPLSDCYAALGLSRLEHAADALACAVHFLETNTAIPAMRRSAA